MSRYADTACYRHGYHSYASRHTRHFFSHCHRLPLTIRLRYYYIDIGNFCLLRDAAAALITPYITPFIKDTRDVY